MRSLKEKRMQNTTKIYSPEWREKIRQALIGHKHSDSTIEKIRISKTGAKYPNRKRKGNLTSEHRKNIGLGLIGKTLGIKHGPRPEYVKKAISQSMIGRPKSWETRERMSTNSAKGSASHSWRGGVWKTNRQIKNRLMQSFEYKKLKHNVLERDNYRCVTCGCKEQLELDHIKPFSSYRHLALEKSNCRILCNPCHRKTPTWGKIPKWPDIYERIKSKS